MQNNPPEKNVQKRTQKNYFKISAVAAAAVAAARIIIATMPELKKDTRIHGHHGHTHIKPKALVTAVLCAVYLHIHLLMYVCLPIYLGEPKRETLMHRNTEWTLQNM